MVPGDGATIHSKKKRVTGLSIVILLLVSSLLGISLNTAAQPDNVFVDGIIRDSITMLPIDSATILLQNQNDGTINSTTTDAPIYGQISRTMASTETLPVPDAANRQTPSGGVIRPMLTAKIIMVPK